jgi:hypothetical protein
MKTTLKQEKAVLTFVFFGTLREADSLSSGQEMFFAFRRVRKIAEWL